MTIQRIDTGDPWFAYYPVEEKLSQRTNTATPLLVDIGGGIGHDLTAFHSKFPFLKGSLILEELPEVIDKIKDLDSNISLIAHSFFAPQPEFAKGAKFYYLSPVLHDWPDKECLEILARIREAMNEDSILLINENALPNTKVPLFPAKLDFWMMVAFSAGDRTVRQFEDLIDGAGFEVVGIHRPDVVVDRTGYLFEAVLEK